MTRVRRERGATGVEYALVVGLLVVALLGAVQEGEEALDGGYDRSVSDLESLPGSDGQIDPGAGSPSSTSSTTSSTTSTTVDVGPSSTTSPSTSTSTSTTTTTTIPTSTTAAPRTTITGMVDVSTDQGSRKWRASAQVSVRHNQTGAPVANATVTVTFFAANGSTTTQSCTTGSSGSCVVTWSNRTAVHAPLLATVTSVAAAPSWDQIEVSAHLQAP